MNKIANAFKFSIILLLLIKLFVNAFALSIESCCRFYEHKTPAVGKFLSHCNNSFFIDFWEYTGFNTGYGFFAPNVASDFIIAHKIVHNNNTVEQKSADYGLKSKEGKVRFSVLNQMFMEKITPKVEEDAGKKFDQYLSAMLKRFNKTAFDDTTIKTVTTTVYLYDNQTLASFMKGPKYRIVPLEECKRTRE